MKTAFIQQLGKRFRLNQKTAIFLLCVLLSVIFWVFTSLSREYETHITIPVSYRNIPFTKYFDSDLPNSLDFYFKGTGFKLAGVHMRERPDSIYVDVTRLSNDQKQLNFQTISLRNQFPGEPKPIRITPEIIHAGFNSRVSKRVPVVFGGSITFRPRFEATEKIRLLPDSVDLAGPQHLLAKKKEVKTEALALSDVSGNKSGTVRLDSSSFAGLVSSTSSIKYYLTVEEYTEGVSEVPVELPVSQRSSVTLIPGTVRITYAVSLSDYPQIRSNDFRVQAEVPFSKMPAKLQVFLRQQPKEVRVIKIEPEFIDYLIQQ